MRKLYLTILSLVFAFQANAQGYEIKVKIGNLSGDSLILGHHFNAQMYPDDTIVLNKKGEGVFKGDTALPGGMYFVFLPGKTYFDILIGDDQHFTIENDTTDFLQNMKVIDNECLKLFVDYQKVMVDIRNQANDLNKQKEAEKDEKNKEKINEKLKKLGEELNGARDKIIEEHPELFVAVFLKATKEVEIPEPPKDENGVITDSSFQYRYYRHHFFDNFDISDARLLRTPIYENKIKQYIDKVIPQIPDSIIPEVDMLVEKSRSSDELFKYMLITLNNHYAKSKVMGMDAVFLHIAEKYYIPEATWSTEEYINKLKENVAGQKNLILGKTAPDMRMVWVPSDHFIECENDTSLIRDVSVGGWIDMHKIEANYLILWFWEKDCGHCRKSTPKLYEIYEELKDEGVKVMAVHMIGGYEGKEKWVDFVNEHALYDWINVWNPFSFEYKKNYDIKSTPVIYLLDKDKKIIGKRLSVEQTGDYIKQLIKRDKEKKK